MNNDGHRDKFSPPAKGWPQFGPDGKVLRDEDEDEDSDEDD